MKTWKPMGLGLLTRVFENDQQPYFVVTALVFFPFSQPRRLLPEVSMWKFAAVELGKDAALDACMPKVRGELLVHGYAFPPGGKQPTCAVRASLGSIEKELWAVGDRRWEANGSTPPVPFERMPITWQNAFGGQDYPENPLGKGSMPDGKVHVLPNIEDPKKLIRTPRDRPTPVSFCPYDETWPQRFRKVGTYDQAWLDKRFPGFAADFDPSFFNAAPDDQQIQGFFAGDEAFSFENMHPAEQTLDGRLPGVITRCFITRASAPDEMEELPMRLDTIRLFPHAERGVLAYRAMTKIDEDDAADIADLMLACDPLGELRPKSHYAAARRNRLDPKRGALYALRDKDLMPPRPAGPKVAEDNWNDTAPLMEMEFAALANSRRYMESKIAEVKEELATHKLTPEQPIPDELPPQRELPDLEDLPEYMEALEAEVDAAKEDAKAKEEEATRIARQQCAEQGLDYDALVASGRAKGGPPDFKAEVEFERLRDMAQLSRNTGGMLPDVESKVANPRVLEDLKEAEKRLLWAYRKFTHHMPAAEYRGTEASASLRRDVQIARDKGESLAQKDFTGADLSGLDLTGVDLTEAMLEAANLSDCVLAGAKLGGATLARADLTGADLTGVSAVDTNFGYACLQGAKLARADLTEANLMHADLLGAKLTGATLVRARLDDVKVKNTDLSGVVLKGTRLMKADLSGIDLSGADLTEGTLHEVTLDRAVLRGANLTSTTLIATRGTGTVLREATLVNLRCVMDCALPECDARGANLERANLRGVDLTGADFSGAKMHGADFSETKMVGAKLYRADAKEARFSKADLTNADVKSAILMSAILERAKLAGADFRGANLFRADMAKIRGDKATNFKDANLRQVRVVAAPPPKQKEAPRGSR